jgi:hypothetical protein
MSAVFLTAARKQTSPEVRVGPKHKVAALQPAAREQEPRGLWPVERIVVALGSPTLRIEVLTTLTQNGAPHERD